MANLEKLKARLEQIKSGQRFPVQEGSQYFFKSKKDGKKTSARIIHYPFSKDEPFVEAWFYYGIGEGPGVLAPRMLGKPDPIHDFCKALRSSGEAKDLELSKKLFAKQRFFAVVVDREDESNTPKYWSFGITLYEALIESLFNSDTAHYLDPKHGIDVDIWQVKVPGKMYAETKFQFKRTDSPLASSQEEIDAILQRVKPFEELHTVPTAQELQKRLSDWLSFQKNEEDISEETVDVFRGGNGKAEDMDIEAEFEEALRNARV